jgi:hypothetical protein
MHVPTNVKSPNNISKWQMRFISAFKGLRYTFLSYTRIVLGLGINTAHKVSIRNLMIVHKTETRSLTIEIRVVFGHNL